MKVSSVLDERLASGNVKGAGVVLHLGLGVHQLALLVHGSTGRECRSYEAGGASTMAAFELLAMILRLTVKLVHPVVVRAEGRVAELCE